MLIHYKGLEHDRFGDAPWVGSLWIAPDCYHKCRGCFNQHLKNKPLLVKEAKEIVSEIKEYSLSEGIILAGLDPLIYPDELCNLIGESLNADLKVMLYTYHDSEKELLEEVPALSTFKNRGILVKYGEYDESKSIANYVDHGVLLATSNQYISDL